MWVRSDMKLVNLEKVLKVDTPQLCIYAYMYQQQEIIREKCKKKGKTTNKC